MKDAAWVINDHARLYVVKKGVCVYVCVYSTPTPTPNVAFLAIVAFAKHWQNVKIFNPSANGSVVNPLLRRRYEIS